MQNVLLKIRLNSASSGGFLKLVPPPISEDAAASIPRQSDDVLGSREETKEQTMCKYGQELIILQIGWTLIILALVWAARGDFAFAQATSSIKCKDGTIYTVSVEGGICNPTQGGAICQSDDAKSNASVSCNNGCGQTKGTGKCEIKAAQVPPRKPGMGVVAPPPAGVRQ